jgi:hypothetical protein
LGGGWQTGREIIMSVITVTVTGVIAPAIIGSAYTNTYGIDFGGFFGPAGGNLAGDPFTVIWTGIDCNCAGTASFNPVIDAVLTINGHSYDFGSGLPELSAYNDFYDDAHQVTIGHLESSNGGLSYRPVIDGSLTTWFAGSGATQDGVPGRDGGFYLNLDSNAAHDTQAFLTIAEPLAVPAPIAGAGIPGLVLAFGCLLAAWRRRYPQRVQLVPL